LGEIFWGGLFEVLFDSVALIMNARDVGLDDWMNA